MSERLKIALVGVGGLGRHILDAILETEKYHVIVLSRKDRTDLPPNLNLTTKRVDYGSPNSLSSALSGVDTVLNLIASFDDSLIQVQRALLPICISSPTIRRYSLSEFEGTVLRRTRAYMPYQAFKMQALKEALRLVRESKAEKGGSKGYTGTLQLGWFANGILADFLLGPQLSSSSPYLDPIGTDLFVSLANHAAHLPAQEGRCRFTSASSVGFYVAKSLELPEWTGEMRISSSEGAVSGLELVQIAERVTSSGGTGRFATTFYELPELEGKLVKSEEAGDIGGQFEAMALLSLAHGKFDWDDDDSSLGDGWKVIKLDKIFGPGPRGEEGVEDFLRLYWKDGVWVGQK